MESSTNEIHFVIDGKVVPKQSANFGRYGAYPKKGVKEYAQKVKASYMAEYPLLKMAWEDKDTPLEVVVISYFPIPKSDSKKNRLWKLLHGFPTKVPDVDNCAKSVIDGCKGVIFPDDAQIVSLKAKKLWSEEPAVEVTIREVSR